jgi:hypothetical protein
MALVPQYKGKFGSSFALSWSMMTQQEGPHQMLAPGSWTSHIQTGEKIDYCSLSITQPHVFCYSIVKTETATAIATAKWPSSNKCWQGCGEIRTIIDH